MRRSFAALLIAATAASRSVAFEGVDDEYGVTRWTIEDGLPQGTVNDLLQTEDGALWIATNGGLLRFDGVEFRTFDYDTLEGLPSVRITGLDHDGSGGLWVLTQGGNVLQFRDGRIERRGTTRVDLDSTQDMLSVISTQGTTNGGLWFRGAGGSLWFTTVDLLSVSKPELIVQSGATYLCRDQKGRLVHASGTDLILTDPTGTGERVAVAPSPMTVLGTGNPEHLWVGLRDGLAIANDAGIQRVSLDPPFDLRVTVLLDDGAGGVWVGTARGVVHVVRSADGNGWTRALNPTVMLETSIVQSLLLDKEHNLWVGTRGDGLARITRRRSAMFRSNRNEIGVAALVSDGANGLWISYANGKLSRGQAVAPDHESMVWQSRESAATFALFKDSRGTLWSSHEGKLGRGEKGQWVEFKLPGRVGPVVETKSGEIWVSTEGGRRISRLTPVGDVAESLAIEGRVISMAADLVDGFWVGEVGAVSRHRTAGTERFGPDEGVPQGDVRCILPEPDGSAWIATYGGGLALLKNGQAKRISRSQGLPNMSLSCIQDDGLDRLWLLSNQGLIIARRADLLAIVEGHAARFDPVVLGPSAGIPEGNFGSPAGFKDENGRLWFGTIEGPVRIDPRAFPFNRTPLRVKIERIVADAQVLDLGEIVEVPSGTRRLVAQFTAFSLTAPERVHFRYRLDGLDDHWNECGAARSASYTILRPGDYQFQVEVRNEDGVWSETPSKIKVRVAASWWQTNWFMVAMAFLAVACVYLFDRVRVGIVSRRAHVLLEATEGRARAEERESRLREELAHVGRVTTAGELATSLAHEVNQPLAAIVTNAQAGRRYLTNETLDKRGLDEILRDIAQEGQRASEIIQRLRNFLRKHKSERRAIDINEVVRDTLPLVRRELQDHRVGLVLKLDPGLKWVDADPIQIQQVVVNLVNNACDALSQTGDDRRIELRTKNEDERVLLEVQDNGSGIAPEVAARLFEPYVTTKASGMGLGLAICRSIVEAHGGRISAGAAPGSGALLRVQLPMHTEKVQDS